MSELKTMTEAHDYFTSLGERLRETERALCAGAILRSGVLDDEAKPADETLRHIRAIERDLDVIAMFTKARLGAH